MQSLKSPYTLYNQQSVGSTLHNNLLFITDTAFLVCDCDNSTHKFLPTFHPFQFCQSLHRSENIGSFPCLKISLTPGSPGFPGVSPEAV